MAKRLLPDQVVLRQLLDYDPETGRLTWRHRTSDMFAGDGLRQRATASWNGKYAGKVAMTARANGYFVGSLIGKSIAAHRVIWKWMTGEDARIIDHSDGDGFNNRWPNLSSVTTGENHRNNGKHSRNTSGVTGVFWCEHVGRWRARITVDRRNIDLGYFDSLSDAKAARRTAKLKFGFTERHGDVPSQTRRKTT